MENCEKEIKRIKRANYIIFGVFAALLAGVLIAGCVYHWQHSFSTPKWLNDPDKRTKIVDDLLSDYTLIGMTESEIVDLLGDNNNDYGYFNRDNRFVYFMGPERGLFSIDSEWLILDFSDGVVVDCCITTD